MPKRPELPDTDAADVARTIATSLGARLEAARMAAGLRQEDAAGHLGRSDQWISDTESGRTIPRADLFGALCSLYGVDAHLLLTGSAGVEAAVLERALPGWSLLSAPQQALIRETVAGFTAAKSSDTYRRPASLTPAEAAQVPPVEQRQRKIPARSASKPAATNRAVNTGGGTKKPATPRRVGARQGPGA